MTSANKAGFSSDCGSVQSQGNGHSMDGYVRCTKPRTEAEIEDWLINAIAKELRIPPGNIDVTAPFETFGLDSVAAVGLTGSLEDWLGCPVDPMAVYDYPTIQSMAKHWFEHIRSSISTS
jgi:acyl carrier protein